MAGIALVLTKVDGLTLLDTPALRKLPWQKEGFDELTLATDNHPREPLVPVAFGNVGLGIEPAREEFKLRGGEFTALNAVEEVLEQGRRKTVPADLGHKSWTGVT